MLSRVLSIDACTMIVHRTLRVIRYLYAYTCKLKWNCGTTFSTSHPTVPQYHSTTVPQSHSTTVPQYHSTTVPQYHPRYRYRECLFISMFPMNHLKRPRI